MKLLFFSSSLSGGGAERVLSNLTNNLAEIGHTVYIAINEDKQTYPINDKISIMVAPQKLWYSGNNPIRSLSRRLKRSIRNFFFTRDAIQKVHPDVIITFLHCNMFAIIIWHGNIPIVHSEHNAYDRQLGVKYHFNRFYLNRFYDRICVLSQFDHGFAYAKGLRNTVFMPNPNTFDTLDENTYKEFYHSRQNILLCGRVDAWYVKGFDVAIKMFSLLSKNFPGVFLDIVGPGSKHSLDVLKDIAKQYGVADKVRFMGPCSNMSGLYRKYKLFVLSSRTEGFPMVITEAMSQGLPCVSFEKLSSSIIIHGRDGLLINDNDILQMSSAVTELLDNENMRFTLGLEAIRNVNRFSSDRIACRWIAMFETLINNK